MNLETISIIVQIVEAITLIIALLYAWLQIRDARRNSSIEATWEVFRELSEEDVRSSRTYVYHNRDTYSTLAEDGGNLNNLSKDDWHHAHQVSNSFDRVGFLVSQKLIPSNLVLEGYQYVIGRSWIALEPFIKANRIARNEPSYQSFFEDLASQVFAKYTKRENIKFMGQNNPTAETTE